MALGLDVRRVFRSASTTKTAEKPGTIYFQEGESVKARHILGLDSTCVNATGRDSSACSNGTSKPRGVTFSDATTAVVSARSTAEDSEETYGSKLKRKGSSILAKKNRPTDLSQNSLKPQRSDSSLRSFYDRSRTPLSVSQQTSDSSSRDFALRRGTPSIMSVSSQEKEHVKQLRLLATSRTSLADRRKQMIHDATPSRASSLRTPASSLFEGASIKEDSQATQPSTARISITRIPLPADNMSPLPKRHSYIEEYPPHMIRTPVDPTQAKINVRRPKVGTKNWFDSIDGESSEDEKDCAEPRLETEFASKVTDAFDHGEIGQYPPRTSSAISSAYLKKRSRKHNDAKEHRHDATELLKAAEAYQVPNYSQPRKTNPFEAADLTQQSLLWLSSSEDSDNDLEDDRLRTPKTKIRDSLINASWDESEVVVGKAVKLGTKSPEVVVKDIRAHGINSQVPKRKGSKLRLETYLEDSSTTTLTQHDLLTSFPETPDKFVQAPSLRESMLSETESIRSTKLMSVTRQEETLIAAMRMKKIAMRKAQSNTDRQDTLRVLEQNAEGSRHTEELASSGSQRQKLTLSRPRSMIVSKPLSTVRNAGRQDSVTTIHTDSMPGQSVRSSIATYLSEGSEDLQLPYSSIYGLPMGSSILRPSPSLSRPTAPRDTFLSEMTVDSTVAPSSDERSASARNSHIVLLDPIEHRLLRDEIPSQLFLEPPYLGWSIQAAH